MTLCRAGRSRCGRILRLLRTCHGLQGAREGAEEYAELPRQHGRGGEFLELFEPGCFDKIPCGSRSDALPIVLRQDSRSPRLDSSAPSPAGTGGNSDCRLGAWTTSTRLRLLGLAGCQNIAMFLCGECGRDSRPRRVSRGFLACALGACLALSSKAPTRMMSTADRAACQQCAVFGLFDASSKKGNRGLLKAPCVVKAAQQCTIQARRRRCPTSEVFGYG